MNLQTQSLYTVSDQWTMRVHASWDIRAGEVVEQNRCIAFEAETTQSPELLGISWHLQQGVYKRCDRILAFGNAQLMRSNPETANVSVHSFDPIQSILTLQATADISRDEEVFLDREARACVLPGAQGYYFQSDQIEVRHVQWGYGICAKEEIPTGTKIHTAVGIHVDHTDIMYTYLLNYAFVRGNNDKKVALIMGIGSLFNGSSDPNVTYDYNEKTRTMTFHTLRDVYPWEELLIDYGEDWFKERA